MDHATWLAARFPTVTVCNHMLGHGYRNPALTVKMAPTLQVLSSWRFMLGIGAGWHEEEYHAYGYDFPKASVRFAQLEEAVQIRLLMWSVSGERFTRGCSPASRTRIASAWGASSGSFPPSGATLMAARLTVDLDRRQRDVQARGVLRTTPPARWTSASTRRPPEQRARARGSEDGYSRARRKGPPKITATRDG